MAKLDLSEKIGKLRKESGLTQEQLAERLNVSRQSVSKWESGQTVPDIDKIVALSDIFHVTADYLLKPSGSDGAGEKTEESKEPEEPEESKKMLQELMEKEKKSRNRKYCICRCISIFLLAFAVIILVNRLAWEIDFLWSVFPGVTLPVIILLIAAAASIIVCIKQR